MQVYLVGGAVRDQLLGLKGADRDYVVVGSTVEEMKKLAYNALAGLIYAAPIVWIILFEVGK